MTARPVCRVSDIPEEGALRVEVDGLAVAVVRDEDGVVHAVSDICSHADVSLSEGEVEDCSIECWLHGSRFDLVTGRPLSLPATQPIPVFTATVEGEQVLVDVDARADAPAGR